MPFPFFQISNHYCQKSCKGFWGFLGSFTTSQFFLSTHFWQWSGNHFKIFWSLHGNAFCFFIFLKERNITTSLLMIHLKCSIVHYANLNSSSIDKPFLNYWPLNMLSRFFRFLVYNYFNEGNLSFFNTNFQNSFQDVADYRMWRCHT